MGGGLTCGPVLTRLWPPQKKIHLCLWLFSSLVPLQSCYGIMELPGPDQMWLCSACEQKEEGKPGPQVGAGAVPGRGRGRGAGRGWDGGPRGEAGASADS